MATARPAGTGAGEVAWASLLTPIGPLVVAATDRGLVRVGLPGQEPGVPARPAAPPPGGPAADGVLD
ncbi:MAG: hypothetical protein ACRDZ9_02295, partial [Acidimicrobiales bacterium]